MFPICLENLMFKVSAVIDMKKDFKKKNQMKY